MRALKPPSPYRELAFVADNLRIAAERLMEMSMRLNDGAEHEARNLALIILTMQDDERLLRSHASRLDTTGQIRGRRVNDQF
jgi:hypothetical protein